MSDKKQESCLFSDISRRRFISTIGAATAGVLLTRCSKDNPTQPSSGPDNPNLPASSKVAVGEVKIYDFNTLKNKMADMLDKLGGLGDLIKSGDTVGLKINLTGGTGSADTWERSTGVNAVDSYWTHPQVVNAIGQLAKDAGASKIVIVEGYYDYESVGRFNFKAVADKLGGTVIQTNSIAPYTGFAKRSVGSNALIYDHLYQNAIFDEMDCFISLPKAKQHVSAGVTHAMKNLVGTLPAPRYNLDNSDSRQAIHNHHNQYDKIANNNLCRVILDLNSATKIHLAVNDAIKTTVGGEGPWCRPVMENRTFNKLIISKDVVAADTISTQVIGFDPNAADYTDTFALPNPACINYLREAQNLGLGLNDLSRIEVINV
ncbi:DUF362 domain-containing protein [candidate division KSB1 bacterium]|nr:DUF362 domain-containing protein [candidate division KSB1 bacterium]